MHQLMHILVPLERHLPEQHCELLEQLAFKARQHVPDLHWPTGELDVEHTTPSAPNVNVHFGLSREREHDDTT